jgi:hypothetical protein
LVRGDSGFGDNSVIESAEKLGLRYIFVARLTQNIQSLCRHEDAMWQKTEIDGLEVQEVSWNRVGQRLIVVRQRTDERPQAGGKQLLQVRGYRFQAFLTNLANTVGALQVWRRYNGRADLENRIKELGGPVRDQAPLCFEFLGHRSAPSFGHLGLHSLCVAPAKARTVGAVPTHPDASYVR